MNLVGKLIDATPEPIARRFSTGGLSSRLARPLVNRVMPDKPVVVTVRSGPAKDLRLPIYPRQEKYYWTGLHDRAVQDAIASVLRPGMVFWDIGAHIGFMSLLASRLVGPEGAVRAFEPMPDNRARLEQAVALNDATNITIAPCAVGERVGVATLHGHDASSMWSLGGTAAGIEVPTETIDSLDTGRSPDLIKIDAEGAELEILKGGSAVVEKQRPIIVVEFSRAHALEEARGLVGSHLFSQLDEANWIAEPRPA